jgi:hypothetical protein
MFLAAGGAPIAVKLRAVTPSTKERTSLSIFYAVSEIFFNVTPFHISVGLPSILIVIGSLLF